MWRSTLFALTALVSPSPALAAALYSPGDILLGFDQQLERVDPHTGQSALVANVGPAFVIHDLEIEADGSMLLIMNVLNNPGRIRVLRIDGDTGDREVVFAGLVDQLGIFNATNADRFGTQLFLGGELGNNHKLTVMDLATGTISLVASGGLMNGLLSGNGLIAESENAVLVGGSATILRIVVDTGSQTLEHLGSGFFIHDMVRLGSDLALATNTGVILVSEAGQFSSVPSPASVTLRDIDVIPDGRLAVLGRTGLWAVDPQSGEIDTLRDDLDLEVNSQKGGIVVAPLPPGAPACSDGFDNDGDGFVDSDGGPLGGAPDPTCINTPWLNREHKLKCGLGYELVFLLLPLMWLHRRRRRVNA